MTQDPWGMLPVKTIVDEASKMISDLGWNLSPSDKITGFELTPTTQLVFECCKCGVIHDPETVNFQTLIDTGKAIGWTIKFRDAGYDAYCKDHSP